jgi:hypothetical protein
MPIPYVDQAAAHAVQAGINGWIYSIGDSMINLNGNGTIDAAARQETPGLIFRMLSFTIDPFTLNFVKDWWSTSLIFFVTVAILYICMGGALALLQTYNPSLMQRLAWLESGTYTDNFELKKWLSNVALSLLFPFITYFGLYIILQLCYIVTGLVAQSALNAIPPTAENIVVYLLMALTYLLLSIIMSIRNIVIVLFCAGGLMLAALYLIPSLQNLVKNIFMYFLLMVFMQPLLAFVAAVGVMFIKALPKELMIFHASLYFGLMVLLLLIGLVVTFGYGTISRMIGIAGRAAL